MLTRFILRRAIAALAAGAALLLAGCGGGYGEGGGETRRFDQYPILLAIGGNGVIEAGRQQGLSVVADRDNWRRNNELGRDPSGSIVWSVNKDLTFGVDVTGSLVADPRRPLLDFDSLEGSSLFLLADFVLSAPAGASTVTRHSVRAANPRGAVTRDVFVVPAGHLYVRALEVADVRETVSLIDRTASSTSVLTSGRRTQLTIELSRPAPTGGATVALRASHSALTLPATAFVPADQTRTAVTITGGAIATEAFVIVTAELGGAEQTIGLWLRSSTPFLRGLEFTSVLNNGINSGTVRLSAPAAGRTVVALASNNSLVSVPATVEVVDGDTFASFSLQVPDQPIPLTAVRVTASHNGVTMVADATLGQRVTDPELIALAVSATNTSNSGPDPCLVNTDLDSRVHIRLQLRFSRPIDTRVHLYSSRMGALRLNTHATIPAGETDVGGIADFVPGPDATADRIRFIQIRAQVLETGQELAHEVQVQTAWHNSVRGYFYTESGPEALELYGGPTFFGGTTLTGLVRMLQAHPYDDVPVELQLLEERSDGTRRGLTSISRVHAYAGGQTARLELALPAVTVDTPVVLVARLPYTEACRQERRTVEHRFTLAAGGGALRDIVSNRAGIFNGESARVTVRLSGAAPAGGTRVPIGWSTTNSSSAGVPDEILIPAGQSEAGFDLSLSVAPLTVTTMNLTARLRGVVRSTDVYLLPEPAVLSIALTPEVVEGGRSSMLRVEVAPAYPVPLDVLLSSNRGAAPVPPALRMPTNLGRAETSITTAVVTSAEIATVTARLRGLTASRTLALTPAVGSGRAWQQLGGALNVFPAPSGIAGPAIEHDALGWPVVAFNENEGIYVKRWDGSAWQQLGAGLHEGNDRAGGAPSLAIDPASGAIYVAWAGLLANGRYVVYLKQWAGSNWSLVGGAAANHNPATSANQPAVRVRGGRPLLAWTEDGRIIVKEWSGSAWAALGPTLGPDGLSYTGTFIHTTQFVLGGAPTADRPIVAWLGGNNTFDTLVAQHASGAWSPLGEPPMLDVANDRVRLGLDATDRAIVANASTALNQFQVRRFDNGQWLPMGAPLGTASGGGIFYGIFGLAFSRTPSPTSTLVAWSQRLDNSSYVAAWGGQAWQPLGGAIRSAGRYGFGIAGDIAIADGATPTMAHVATSSNHPSVDRALYVYQFR